MRLAMNEEINWQVPWSGRGLTYSPDEIQTVIDVMNGTGPLTQAKHQSEFESKLASFIQTPHAFAVSSATAALELSALLCQLKPGDEVILPAHTFCATAIPFARTGAKLVWADIEPDSFVVSAKTIEPLITQKTKVIIPVHLYGLVADMDPIMELAQQHNLIVMEDSAQALGATYKGRPAGSIGDFGCFSMHSHKNISTLGEGGVLTVKDPIHAKKVPGLRHNGVRGFDSVNELYWKPAMSNVDFDIDGLWPYNLCLGEAQCALGTQLLDRVEQLNAIRKDRRERIITALKGIDELSFQQWTHDATSSYHLLPVRYNGNRDELMKLMAFEFGVKCVVQYYPLYRYPMFQKAGFGNASCPETDSFFDSMLSLPFHPWMSEQEEQTLINALTKSVQMLRKLT